MNKQHKHAELIKAWADGAEIEWYDEYHNQYFNCTNPNWRDNTKYRIKPKPKWEKRQEVPLFYEMYDCYIPQKIHDLDTIHQFVAEFETDWDNQHYEVLKSNVGYQRWHAKFDLCWPFSVCAIRMSKECAEKLCKMLNNGEVELHKEA